MLQEDSKDEAELVDSQLHCLFYERYEESALIWVPWVCPYCKIIASVN